MSNTFLKCVGRVRIAVRDHQLGDRGAVADLAPLARVVVGDVVQHEALARMEADAQLPVLPAHAVAVEREARALRLRDLERLHVAAVGPAAAVAVVAARRRRRRAGRVVVEAQQLQRVDVDRADQAVQRPRVLVVECRRSFSQQMARTMPPRARLVRAGAPGLDVHLLRVVDAALRDRLAEPRVGAHHVVRDEELVAGDGRLDALVELA